MPPAALAFHRKLTFDDGAILEMVIWLLPEGDAERPHRLKYRLYYGSADGACVVRYDNERGKGDHRHYGQREEPYLFTGPQQLMADFLADVRRARSKLENSDE